VLAVTTEKAVSTLFFALFEKRECAQTTAQHLYFSGLDLPHSIENHDM
jgi:hypothetical protein